MSVLGGCEEKNKTPVLDERVCPNCGDEVEVFTVKGRLIDDFACVCVGIYSIRRSRLFRRLRNIRRVIDKFRPMLLGGTAVVQGNRGRRYMSNHGSLVEFMV